ncbi:hypothetical protein D0O09_32175 [Pseudomonas putida]|nr:hypothetical protein D0O09_32175 [Pseudomonas putida]
MDYSQLLERSFLQMAHTSEKAAWDISRSTFSGSLRIHPVLTSCSLPKAVEVCAALGKIETMREYVTAKDGHLWFLLMFKHAILRWAPRLGHLDDRILVER